MATIRELEERTGMATELQWNPYQAAFLDALSSRLCPKCGETKLPPTRGEWKCLKCDVKLTVFSPRAYRWFTLIAGRRGGKTRIGALAATIEASIANTSGLVCGPTYDDLHSFIWPHIIATLPSGWIKDWSEKHQVLTLKNGSTMKGLSLDDPEAARGYGVNWMWIDEPAKISEKAWDVARPTLTDKIGIAWFTGTPAGFNWVYNRLWVPAVNAWPGYWGAKYLTKDNPIISPVELADAKRTLSEDMYRQEYEAEFTDFLGAIYGGLVTPALLREEKEVQKFIPEWPNINADRPAIVGIDPGAGTEHPTAAAIAVKTEKGIILVGEYRETTKPAVYHAGRIKKLNRWGLTQISYVIDKQRKQEQIEFAQHGIFAAQVEGGPGSVAPGIDRVKAWLEKGQLKIVEALCPMMVAELSTYRWADPVMKSGELKDKPKPFKLRDDLADVVRYICVSWPNLPVPPQDEWAGMRPLGSFRPQDRQFILEERKADKMRRGEWDGTELIPLDDPRVVEGMGEFYF